MYDVYCVVEVYAFIYMCVYVRVRVCLCLYCYTWDETDTAGRYYMNRIVIHNRNQKRSIYIIVHLFREFGGEPH